MHPLIAPTTLADMIRSEPPALLDVRWRLNGPPGLRSWLAGHLPGAVYLDLDTDLSAPPGAGGRHPLPEPALLQAVLRGAGVRQNHPVVVYDDGDGSIAARAWWLLRWAGHQAVAVLDGGYPAWVADGLPVTTDPPTPRPGDIEVVPGGMPVLDATGAARLARTGVLLDARAAERYRGDTEPIDPRAGHVPGARSAPFTGHIGADGRWLSPAGLAARFERIGVSAAQPVGAYCGSGVTASSVVLALEVAGFGPASLYAGSWSHWCLDPARPVATGDQPG